MTSKDLNVDILEVRLKKCGWCGLEANLTLKTTTKKEL